MTQDNSAYYAFQPPTAVSKVVDPPMAEPESCVPTQVDHGNSKRVQTWLDTTSQSEAELLPLKHEPSSDAEEPNALFTPPEPPASIPSLKSGRTDDIRLQNRRRRKRNDHDSTTWRDADDSAVRNDLYRSKNLKKNAVHLCSWDTELPEHVAALVSSIRAHVSDSSIDHADLQRLHAKIEQLEIGAFQEDVRAVFTSGILPPYEDHDAGICKRTADAPMRSWTRPSSSVNNASLFKIATSRPSLIYGYRLSAFTDRQQDQITQLTERTPIKGGGLFPFFALEFEGDGGQGGAHLWAATNKLLGAVSSCNIVTTDYDDNLGVDKTIPAVPAVAFGVTSNGTEARIYVAWTAAVREGESDPTTQYYTKKIESFLLSDPEHLRKLSNRVRDIVAWGEGERLAVLRESLDRLAEHGAQKRTDAIVSK